MIKKQKMQKILSKILKNENKEKYLFQNIQLFHFHN
jgi:hypothetical protein